MPQLVEMASAAYKVAPTPTVAPMPAPTMAPVRPSTRPPSSTPSMVPVLTLPRACPAAP